MFKFLKDKLKSVVSSFSKKVETESKELEEPLKVPPKKEHPVSHPTPPRKDEHAHKIEHHKEQIKEPEHKKPETKKEVHKPEIKKPVQPKKEIIAEKKVELPKKEEVLSEKVEVKPAEIVKIEKVKEQIKIPEEKLEPKEELKPVQKKVEPEKKGFFAKIFGKKEEKKPVEIKEIPKEVVKEKPKVEEIKHEEPKVEEKKGFFEAIAQKFTHVELSDKKFEELFWDLEITLLENNVAVEVIEKIKADMKLSIVGIPLRKSDVTSVIIKSLRKSIEELFEVPVYNLAEKISEKKPFVILFLGINGAGKTTTIAKVAHMLKGKGYKIVMAAGDTFRAAAIQQLETHANNLGIKLIKHDYGSDSAAVAYDAIAHAKANNIDVVLIDTAGRLHSNTNLMDELKKIARVSAPDLKIFIGESITGNDCIEQAKQFNESVGIDGIILSKADVDEKGGAAISVSYVTGKPILYLGVGQNYGDLQEFSKKAIIEGLGLD